ncbi:MAG: Gfo/Idh/MocA family oxidoreductase [Gammaproteobacteria bacterium]|nr:Gfo/Idh/MocA family oxidoreductase [Gammaproteobacteria bacterium]
MFKPVRVAVIGVGYLGKIHAKIYHEMEGVELVAVVDIDETAAAETAGRYGCEGLTSAGGLLNRVDAVSIVVPTSAHLEVSRPFLEAGIHTMLEKPIAPSVKESARVVAFAKQSRAILQIGHLERFNAGVMKLAELAENPRFIECHRLGEFVERATDVDVVTDLMIHDIDIVLTLVDSELRNVSASGTRVVTDVVDIANARLEFENGAVANVTASRVSREPFRRIRVFSENRYLGLNFANQQLEEIRAKEVTHGDSYPELEHSRIDVVPQLPLNAELAHFIECIHEGKEPLVRGEEGLVAVEVAELVRQKIYESIVAGDH